MDRYKVVVCAMLVSGCAGSATHEVVSAYQVDDGGLSCSQIRSEMMKAQFVIDGVNKDKEDWTGADVVDGLLWFPFNLIAKDSNYRDALAAGNQRMARLAELEKEKNCPVIVAEPSAKGTTNPAASEERRLLGSEITRVYAGSTLDAFKSENDGIKSDNIVQFYTDGTISGRTKSGYSDTGNWWIEDDKLCRKWRRWQDSVANCYAIMLVGNRTRWVQEDGRTHGLLRSRKITGLEHTIDPDRE